MRLFKRLFDFYLGGSLHVALSVYALVRMTQWQLSLGENRAVAWFAFFGTVAGYNFVKYDELLRIRRTARPEIRAYAALSLACMLGAACCFFEFRLVTQLLAGAVLALTALYTLPFFPNSRNARNWAGIKIYIVTLCWVGVTVWLPVADAGCPIDGGVLLKSLQRFILVFVLVLIFEIVDLARDDAHLQTVPQTIGARRTRQLGFMLLAAWLAMACAMDMPSPAFFRADCLVAALIAGFMAFATPQRPRYYTWFWAEGVPVAWWIAAAFWRSRA